MNKETTFSLFLSDSCEKDYTSYDKLVSCAKPQWPMLQVRKPDNMSQSRGKKMTGIATKTTQAKSVKTALVQLTSKLTQ